MLARLSQDVLPKGRQGVERRIPIQLLETLALATDLAGALGLQFREAFEVAESLTGTATGAIGQRAAASRLGEFTRLEVDREALRREIEQRLASAIESVVRPRRGRPRSRDTTLG